MPRGTRAQGRHTSTAAPRRPSPTRNTIIQDEAEASGDGQYRRDDGTTGNAREQNESWYQEKNNGVIEEDIKQRAEAFEHAMTEYLAQKAPENINA
jgi:hypothetical protein